MEPAWKKIAASNFRLTSRTYEIPKGVAKRDPLGEVRKAGRFS